MFVAGYGHFLRAAASLQWDEAAVDLSGDARSWPELDPALRERLELLVAGFCVGEAAVAADIVPFELAADDADVAACFGAQAVDEARHARFFDRFAREVMGVRGAMPADRREALLPRVDARFADLFEVRLPAVARELATGAPNGSLADAVALYHLLLEGVVFTAGQLGLLGLLERADPPLPGLGHGVELVLADERWHIGFGTRLLEEIGVGPAVVEGLLAEAEIALRAWGDAVDDEVGERVLTLHGRRLRAAGLLAERAVEPAPTT